MTTHLNQTIDGNLLEIRLNGKLTRKDYAMFGPETEALIEREGKIRVLLILEDFHGWDSAALWEDAKWDARHFNHISRIAVVGEKRWHQWMTSFCKPFTSAEVRYFEHAQLPEARLWVADESR